MFSKQNADELQSRVIAFLRFPLIVGVVFIHNYRPSIIVGNEVMGSETHMPTFYRSIVLTIYRLDFCAFVFLLFRFSLLLQS